MKRRLVLAAGLVGVLLVSVGYLVGRAWAGGVPLAMPLTYSGLLTDPNGTPLAGTHLIDVQLLDATSMNSLCDSATVSESLTAGRFSVTLPDACATAVHNNPNVLVQVSVDTSKFTTRLGAVPYALEAGGVDYANVRSVGGAWPGTVNRTAGAKVTVTKNGKTVSVDATYCGTTGVQSNGSLGGYSGANQLCRAVSGCGQSAHVCTNEEILRTVYLGVALPSGGVYASGLLSQYEQVGGRFADCEGFTSAAGNFYAPGFSGGSINSPSQAVCNQNMTILCCD